MAFILDASVALAWCFSDEMTPTSMKLLERLETETAFVPSIWPLELGNILVAAERKKRLTYAEIMQFLALLGNLNIHVDAETSSRAFHEILLLAHSEQLTTYDASYLELSMRLGMPLATKDVELRQAAKHVGVELIIC